MSRLLEAGAVNPGRGGYQAAVALEERLDRLRGRIAELFDAPGPDRVIFTLNGTDALNMAIKGVMNASLATGGEHPGHIITSVLEHNSVLRPVRGLEMAGRAQVTLIDCDDSGFVKMDELARAVRPNTRLIILTHASNVIGTVQNIAEAGRIAKACGALLLLDAAQTAGAEPLSMRQIGADLIAMPGHKGLLGPAGTGLLLVGDRCAELPGLGAWREGGTGGDSLAATQPRGWPTYWEAGTPNSVGLIGLAAGVEALLEMGVDTIGRREGGLARLFTERFSGDPRIQIDGPPDREHCLGTVSFNIAGLGAAEAGVILDEHFDIAVRTGLHCAPAAHARLGHGEMGSIRISMGPYSGESDVERLIEAVEELAGG